MVPSTCPELCLFGNHGMAGHVDLTVATLADFQLGLGSLTRRQWQATRACQE